MPSYQYDGNLPGVTNPVNSIEPHMNLAIVGAIAMLVVWVVGALVLQGPGWIHLLLTLGVSLLIYGIVARDESRDSTTERERRR
jgi:uncharacterized membrane protein